MSRPPVADLPRLTLLTPRQQMAIDSACCASRLGMHGRVLDEVRYQGFAFRLRVCVPQCAPRAHWGTW